MLSIGKLSAASVDYYTVQLSHSVGEDVPVLRGGGDRRVDYYADHRAPARWMGSGLAAAGVDPQSPVTKEAFARLMGHETLSGESMTRAHAAHGKVAAFDHTLSAPKSVSLLYAFGDSTVRQQVREAHLEATVKRWSTWRNTAREPGRSPNGGTRPASGSGPRGTSARTAGWPQRSTTSLLEPTTLSYTPTWW